MESVARMNQLEGCSPESCLSWLRSYEWCPKHDLFMLVYRNIVNVQNCESMGDFGNAAILIHLFTRWHHQQVLKDIELYRSILQNYMNILK